MNREEFKEMNDMMDDGLLIMFDTHLEMDTSSEHAVEIFKHMWNKDGEIPEESLKYMFETQNRFSYMMNIMEVLYYYESTKNR